MKIARFLPRFREASREISVLASRENLSRAQLDALQLERVNALWSHATAHVPYYRTLAADRKLPPQFDDIAQFHRLVPILPKPVVRERSADLVSEARLPGMWKFTSGTTGRPTGAYWGVDAHRQALRTSYRFYQSWGVDVFDRTAFLWGPGASPLPGFKGWWSRTRQPLFDRLRNRLRISACSLDRPHLHEYLRKIEAFRPVMIYGYSRALYLLAMEAERLGFKCPSLKVIVASAEPAWPHMIDRIVGALGAPLAREDGALECGVIATDAMDHTLRVREDRVIAETLPRENDGRYDIVVTVMNNPSFPLIRYAIGDVTDTPLQRPEHGFAYLSSVGGRDNDLLRSRSGEYVHWVQIELAIQRAANHRIVRRYNVHQRRDGAVHINVELDEPSRAPELRHYLDLFADTIAGGLDGYPVTIDVVDAIPQTSAGKHKVVTSELYDINTSSDAAFTPPAVARINADRALSLN